MGSNSCASHSRMSWQRRLKITRYIPGVEAQLDRNRARTQATDTNSQRSAKHNVSSYLMKSAWSRLRCLKHWSMLSKRQHARTERTRIKQMGPHRHWEGEYCNMSNLQATPACERHLAVMQQKSQVYLYKSISMYAVGIFYNSFERFVVDKVLSTLADIACSACSR